MPRVCKHMWVYASYVYMCIYVYVSMWRYASYVYACVCVCNLCECMPMSICACVYIHVCVSVWLLYLYVHMCVCICVNVCHRCAGADGGQKRVGCPASGVRAVVNCLCGCWEPKGSCVRPTSTPNTEPSISPVPGCTELRKRLVIKVRLLK